MIFRLSWGGIWMTVPWRLFCDPDLATIYLLCLLPKLFYRKYCALHLFLVWVVLMLFQNRMFSKTEGFILGEASCVTPWFMPLILYILNEIRRQCRSVDNKNPSNACIFLHISGAKVPYTCCIFCSCYTSPYGCSENSDTPKSSHPNRVFHYKPSILGYPQFLETPIYMYTYIRHCPCLTTNLEVLFILRTESEGRLLFVNGSRYDKESLPSKKNGSCK